MSKGLCNFEAYSERDIKLIGDIFEKDIEVYDTIEISKKCVLEGWCTWPEVVIVSNSIWKHIAKIL